MRGFTRDTGAAGVGFGTTLDVPQVHGHSLTGSPTIDTLRSRPAVIGVAIVGPEDDLEQVFEDLLGHHLPASSPSSVARAAAAFTAATSFALNRS